MSSSSSSIIRLIILLSFDLSLILYLFALKRDRGEKRKREKKPFRIHLSAKNFETSPYLKLLIKITLLIIISFLNFHEFLARNKQHLFIENNIVTGQLYTCSTIYRPYIVARDPSRNEIPLDPSAHPREIIIAGQVTLGPSNPVIFLTKNRRPFLDGASPRSDISNKRARPSCVYIFSREMRLVTKAPRVARLARERESIEIRVGGWIQGRETIPFEELVALARGFEKGPGLRRNEWQVRLFLGLLWGGTLNTVFHRS